MREGGVGAYGRNKVRSEKCLGNHWGRPKCWPGQKDEIDRSLVFFKLMQPTSSFFWHLGRSQEHVQLTCEFREGGKDVVPAHVLPNIMVVPEAVGGGDPLPVNQARRGRRVAMRF